jgi:phosphatidate cytidylyltransferase
LRTRVLVALVLLPVALGVIYLGGWIFALAIAAIAALASLEYAKLFHAGGLCPSGVFIAGGSALLVLTRQWSGFEHAPLLVSLLVLACMAYFLVTFERGNQHAAIDFGITLSGVFYMGWLAAYLVSLRALPDGMWWVLTVLAAVWIADSMAYVVGSRIGRHKMTPRLSPKKSWEGYFGGIIFGIPITALLAVLWQVLAGAPIAVAPGNAAVLALAIGTLTVLGDLGESMIKRQFGVKDSGHLLPGHGGVFDRIDSWLWAGVIGYYLITYFLV